MNHIRPNNFVFASLLFWCFVGFSYANDLQDENEEPEIGLGAEIIPKDQIKFRDLQITISEKVPVLDGELTDSIWNEADKFDLYLELYPTRYARAPFETIGYVAATKTHLYVAFDAKDPHPEKIRSAVRERDANKNDDYVSIIIDTSGTLAKKYEFRVNPHGSISDVLQDTISDRYIYDWDTDWEGAGKINDEGYSVEIAIPFTSIRAPEKHEGEEQKGVAILKRTHPRSVDRTVATAFMFQRSDKEQLAEYFTEEEIEDITGPKLTVTPHYVFHYDEERSIGGEWDKVDNHDLHSVGLDANYRFNDSQSLSITVNPNYNEVEADISRDSINNPFNVFQPEKRRIFRSATEYYNSLIPAVYTRNIISPEFGISYLRDDIYSSTGSFFVTDRETEVIIPDSLGSDTVELLDHSKSAAFRYRYSKDKKTFGGMGTLRKGDDYHNTVLGLDGLWDIGTFDKFRYQLLFSDTKYPERFADDLCEEDDCTQAPPPDDCALGNCSVNAGVLRTDFGNTLRGHAFQARYKHDGPSGLYWLSYEDIAPDFRADLGFVKQVDIRRMNFAYGQKWYLKPFENDEGNSRIKAYLIGTHMRSHDENDTLENAASVWGEFWGSYQSLVRLGLRYRDRAVNRIDQGTLEYGDNTPLFEETYLQWYFETSPWSHVTINFDGRYGDIADADNLVLGEMLEVKPKVTFRYEELELKLQGTFREFDVDQGELYNEQFLTLTALYRPNHDIAHRLLYKDDITERNVPLWLDQDELSKEKEKTLEYTLIYKPQKEWSILSGIKLEYEYESDVDDDDLTNREFYFKVERRL